MNVDVTDALMAELNRYVDKELSAPTQIAPNDISRPHPAGAEMSRDANISADISKSRNISDRTMTTVFRSLPDDRNKSGIESAQRGLISTNVLDDRLSQATTRATTDTRASSILQEPPPRVCPKCQFAHGNDICVVPCRSRGTAGSHSSNCPDKDSKGSTVREPRATINPGFNGQQPRRKYQSISGNPAGVNTYPGMLSRACQERGFNPSINVLNNPDGYSYAAQVTFGDPPELVVDLKGHRFCNQQLARDTAARKALEFLETSLKYRLPLPLGSSAVTRTSRSSTGYGATRGGRNIGNAFYKPPVGLHHSEVNAERRADEALPKKEDTKTSNEKVREIPNIVDLPSNVEPAAVEGIAKQVLGSGATSIIINLPGNVSTEVAAAYGKAFSRRISENNRRHSSRSRDRSRSPPRQPFADRNRREREQERERERDRERNRRWTPPRHPHPQRRFR